MVEKYALEDLLPTAVWVEGIPLMNLEILREGKRQMGREKDIRDIQSIADYLSKK